MRLLCFLIDLWWSVHACGDIHPCRNVVLANYLVSVSQKCLRYTAAMMFGIPLVVFFNSRAHFSAVRTSQYKA